MDTTNLAQVSLLFSGVVTLATVVYAILTWKLVAETAALRRAQTDPFVVAMMTPSENAFGFVDFLLRNDGLGPAYDVVVSVDDDGVGPMREKIAAFGFVKRATPYFPARHEFRSFLESSHPRESVGWRATVHVSYRTPSGEQREHSYHLDMSLMEGTSRLGTPFTESAAKSLEKISKSIESAERYLASFTQRRG